ncbi:hypothetical protein CQP30_09150 [Yersinia pestis]|nr:hypothetical protein EGX46_14955 [Yersinia pestis]OSZ84226.1 hypothetical protein A7720_20220 [Yersinia pestis subsp. microtus bv. Caucasica]OUY19600.1 hypothetical protein BFI42_05415 [Yersinia pestis subsp. microtus bv. Altaica]OVY70394.1 hypothetical protein BFI50_20415 [Yersinia pestis subsp. microtus bv. Xilingolensis]OVY90684.1 hypothetical protein BFI53_06300 [Yersinia pestis subsp. microtus]QFR84662.1 hypothetical protein DJY80_06970 [Yersinia pestis subsp. pestis bv. Medievalis]
MPTHSTTPRQIFYAYRRKSIDRIPLKIAVIDITGGISLKYRLNTGDAMVSRMTSLGGDKGHRPPITLTTEKRNRLRC